MTKDKAQMTNRSIFSTRAFEFQLLSGFWYLDSSRQCRDETGV